MNEVFGIWLWPSIGWSSPHGCEVPGLRWAADTTETRLAHPDGRPGWSTENALFGFRPFGG